MKLVCPAVVALALLGAADAFRVQSSAAAPPADILGEHQELEKVFSVYSEEPLEKLSIAIAGPVFVAYEDALLYPKAEPTTATPEPTTATPEPTTTTPEPTMASPTVTPAVVVVDDEDDDGSWDGSSSSSASGSGSSANGTVLFPDEALALHAANKHHAKETLVAKITITGNSSELLELVEVVPYKKNAEDGFRVTYKNTDAAAEGFVLTRIELAEKHAVRHLMTEVASSVDVASGVLATDSKKKLKIAADGATHLFIAEESDITAQELDLDVAGSGSIQFLGAALKLDGQLSASVAGSGALAVHADSVTTAAVKTSVSGSGGLYVMTSNLTADDFSSAVYGSAFASVRATENGKVDNEKLTVAGSGAVYAGSVVAARSSVDVWGSGVAYVQVTDKLKTSASYSGVVYYVGDKPARVKTSGWFFWRSSVKPAEEDKVMAHEAVASPAVYPAHVSLVLKAVRHNAEPVVKTIDEASQQQMTFAMLTTHLVEVAHGPNGLLIFGGVAAGLVAAVFAAHSYQQHRVRRHYTPLV